MVPIVFALIPTIIGAGLLFVNFTRERWLKVGNSHPYWYEWIQKQGCPALWSVQLSSFNVSMKPDLCGSDIHHWYIWQCTIHDLCV